MTSVAAILRKFKQSDRNGYWFVLPYVIFFLAFVAYPLCFSIILIFHRWNIVTPRNGLG